MKKNNKFELVHQSNSVILDEEFHVKDKNCGSQEEFSLDMYPVMTSNHMNQQIGERIYLEPNQMKVVESFFSDNKDNSFENFKSQMLLSGEAMNNQIKDFAGETFSQISSTFEHFPTSQNPKPHSLVQSTAAPGANKNLHNHEYKMMKKQSSILNQGQANKDELLDQDILDKSSLQSPTGMNDAIIIGGENDTSECQGANSVSNILLNHPSILQQNSTSINIQNNSFLYDEGSIFKYLDQSIQEDIQKNKGESQDRQDQFEYFKEDCNDVISKISQISQGMKMFIKENRNDQKLVKQFKELEMYSASALMKVKEIEETGVQFYKNMMSGPQRSKVYIDNLKQKIHNKLTICKDVMKKVNKKAEDQKFEDQINEYELKQRVIQLEEALSRQKDDINRQANKIEQLKFERVMIQKNYEKKLQQLMAVVGIIQKSIQEDRKSVQKLQKNNNSFCVQTNYHQSLFFSSSSDVKKKDLNGQKEMMRDVSNNYFQKENESFLSNQGESGIMKAKSVQSQIKYLYNLLKEYRACEKMKEQEGGSCFDQSNSIKTFLNQLVNLQNLDQIDQQAAQQYQPEGSSASVNQAFIGSIKFSEDAGESRKSKNNNNNTSFFGFDQNLGDPQKDLKQNFSAILSQIISSRRKGDFQGGSGNEMHHNGNFTQSLASLDDKSFKQRIMNLTNDEIEKLAIEQFYRNNMKYEGNDVKTEDLLEISKKTFSSRQSSMRTGRGNKQVQKYENKNKEQQPHLLRMLDGASNIQRSQINTKKIEYSQSNQRSSLQQLNHQQYENKNNSTLDMSFKQNEIQVLNGKIQGGRNNLEEGKFDGDGDYIDDSKFMKDEELQDFLKLNDKISQRDLQNGRKNSNKVYHHLKNNEDEEEGTINVCDRNISIKTGMNFLSSLTSEEEMKNMRDKMYQDPLMSNHQSSIEEDLQMLNNFNKNSQGLHILGDLSRIDTKGNNSLHLNTGGMSKIHIEEGDDQSIDSEGSDLLQLERDLQHRKKRESQEVVTIKVQDRIVNIPKLDFQVFMPSNRKEQEILKKLMLSNNMLISNQFGDSASSIHQTSQSYLQSKSINNQNQLSSNIMINELDQNIQNDDDLKQNDDSIEECKDLANMFGDFQKELQLTNSQQQFQSLEKKSSNKSMKKSEQKEEEVKVEFSLEKCAEQSIVVKVSSNGKQSSSSKKDSINNKSGTKKSMNQSMKKSQSDSQLFTIEQNNSKEQINNEISIIEPAKESRIEQEEGEEKKERKLQKIKVFSNVNLNMGKLKTPKNGGIKLNFNQLNSNGEGQRKKSLLKANVNNKKNEQDQQQINQQEIVSNPTAPQTVQNTEEIHIGQKQNPISIKMIRSSKRQLKVQQQSSSIVRQDNNEEQQQKVTAKSLLSLKKNNNNDLSMLYQQKQQNLGDMTQIQQENNNSFYQNSFYQDVDQQKQRMNQSSYEDNEAVQIKKQKLVQRSLKGFKKGKIKIVNFVGNQKPNILNEIEEEYNPQQQIAINGQQQQDKRGDQNYNKQREVSILHQNYLSASNVANHKRPSVNEHIGRRHLIEKTENNIYQQFSQRNPNNGLSDKQRSNESDMGGVKSSEPVESQEFEIEMMSEIPNQSKYENDSKQESYYQSPAKIMQRNSNSCTPSKRIGVPIISKQLKIKPNNIKISQIQIKPQQKNNNNNIIINYQNQEIVGSQLNKNNNNKNRRNFLDQSQIYQEEHIGDRTDIHDDNQVLLNFSILQNQMSNQNNISHMINYQDESIMINHLSNNPDVSGVLLKKSMNTRKIKFVGGGNKKSRERVNQNNANYKSSSHNTNIGSDQSQNQIKDSQILTHQQCQQQSNNNNQEIIMKAMKLTKNIQLQQQQQEENKHNEIEISMNQQKNIKIQQQKLLRSNNEVNQNQSKDKVQSRPIQKTLNESRQSRQSPQSSNQRSKLSNNSNNQQDLNQLQLQQNSNKKQKKGELIKRIKKDKKGQQQYINVESAERKSKTRKSGGSGHTSHSSVSSFRDL